MKGLHRFVVLAAILALLTGCSSASQQGSQTQQPVDRQFAEQTSAPEPASQPEPEPARAPEPVEIIVGAAASLTNSLTEAKEVFEKANPHITVTINFASSGSLQQQIEQGAGIDVFVSAAEANMNALVDKGLVDAGAVRRFVSNAMVLVRHKDAPELVQSWEDLVKAERVAIGNPAHTPIGKAVVKVLETMGTWDEVQDNVVLGETVGQALTFVESGEVDAGIVFMTDVLSSDKVVVVAEAPPGSHDPFIYPIAVVKDSKKPEAAGAFVDFLCSDEGQAIMAKYGFSR